MWVNRWSLAVVVLMLLLWGRQARGRCGYPGKCRVCFSEGVGATMNEPLNEQEERPWKQTAMQQTANDRAARLGAITVLEREVARSTERWREVPLARYSGVGESYQPGVLF